MNALVTGAAGFIGFNLSKKLLLQGHTVYGVDNYSPDYDIKIKEQRIKELNEFDNFEFLRFDVVNDAMSLLQNLHDIDYLIHLAAKDLYYDTPGNINYSPFLETNVMGTSRMFELGKNLRVKKFVFASTHSVYGVTKKGIFTEKKILPKPISPHGASKLAAEQVIEFMSGFYKVPAIILRIFSVYGPGMRPHTLIPLIISKLDKNEAIKLYADENESRDFIYIEDVTNYIKESLNKRIKFQIINIASGTSTKYKDLAVDIAKIMHKEKILSFEKPDKLFNEVVVKNANADISKAKKILKYTPQTSLNDGLEKTVTWYQEHPEILQVTAL